MHETDVANDPLFRLIEWHSNAAPARGDSVVAILDHREAMEAALLEWHTNAALTEPERQTTAS
jgi:hypothetical protein